MVFRTEINLNKSTLSLNYNSNILLIGSCFSENIGKKLENLHFKTIINPFGTIYNVVSIFKVLQRAALKQLITAEELDCNGNLYSHCDFHSSYNDIDPNAVVCNINAAIELLHDHLANIDNTYITLGTSWVFKREDKNQIVSNCHKRPQHFFEKHLLTLEETLDALTKLEETIHAINPHNQIILTVSPVRHIKDGIVQNQVSKAILLQAIYTLCQNGKVHYFPAYELMMDDLRDYRFYKADLIHPSDHAIDYIWEKFETHYFEEETKSIIAKVDKVNAFLNHRPYIIDEMHRSQTQKFMAEIEAINTKYGLSLKIKSL